MAAPAPPDKSSAEGIASRLERLPTSIWHLKVRILIGIVTFFEGFDQMLVAYTLPVVTEQWDLMPGQTTMLITGGSVGMLAGALVSGWLSDRIGRVRMVCLCVFITATASLALAVVPGPEVFIALRFIQGLGIGGEVPIAATYIGEIAKSHKRGRFVLLYELVFPAGLMAAAVISAWVVPNMGWRWLFVIGALPLMLIPFILRHVPESPRWLASRGQTDEADRQMTRIETEVRKARKGEELPEPKPLEVKVVSNARPSPRELVTGIYLRRTIVISILWFTGYFINYALTSWLPTIYTSVYGVPLDRSLQLSLLSNVAGFVGCLGAALLIDRIGRKLCLGGGLLFSGATLLLLGWLGADTTGQVMLLATLATMFVFLCNMSLYLYTPELFPTRNRAMGTALGGAWNRIGVILGPIVVGGLVGAGASMGTVFTVLGIVGLTGAAAAVFAVETNNRSLEELSP